MLKIRTFRLTKKDRKIASLIDEFSILLINNSLHEERKITHMKKDAIFFLRENIKQK